MRNGNECVTREVRLLEMRLLEKCSEFNSLVRLNPHFQSFKGVLQLRDAFDTPKSPTKNTYPSYPPAQSSGPARHENSRLVGPLIFFGIINFIKKPADLTFVSGRRG